MSSSRARKRALLVVSFCLSFLAMASVWTVNQRASIQSDQTARHLVSAGFLSPDKGGITPQAGAIVVNSLSDAANGGDGLCTLREAIMAANSDTASGVAAGECAAGGAGSDTIDLTGVTGTINLTGALPNITANLIMNGPGSANLTVRRNTGGDYRIFNITNGSVTISGLTVTNGKAPSGTLGDGGGIQSFATPLILTDVVVSANRAGDTVAQATFPNRGGGIFNTGDLMMTNCSVIGNTAGPGLDPGGLGGSGGGIYNLGTLTMTGCTVTGNNAGAGGNSGNAGTGGSGGGIFDSGTMTIKNSAVTGNSAGAGGTGGNGGGIFCATGTSTLTNVQVSNNTSGNGGSGGHGGGLAIIRQIPEQAPLVNLINSTVSGNQSGVLTGGSGATYGFGGGIYLDDAQLIATGDTISGNVAKGFGGGLMNKSTARFFNSTFSGNSAPAGAGGGIFNFQTLLLANCTVTANPAGVGVVRAGSAIETKVINTIIAGNGGAGASDVSGLLMSEGHNLIGKSDGTNGFTNGSNGDQVGTVGSPINPQLGVLANNSGPTLTHALLPGSPALDAGDDCVAQVALCADTNIPLLTTDQRGAPYKRSVDGPDVDAVATTDIGAYEAQGALGDGIPDTNTNEDTQVIIPFNAGDASTIASVTATSADPVLVPNDVAHLSVIVNGSTVTLTINPGANQFGSTNISVTVNRTGGGSDNRTFLLTVNPVNDVPSFTKGADQTVNNNAGAQSVANWGTAISAGPANESGQTLTFQITNNTNPALFSAGPAISSAGTLTYTPASNGGGSATITLNLRDSGGTANGGVDTSASQTFTITVTPIGGFVSFAAASSNTTESSGSTTVTVNRSGDASRAVSVDYSTNADNGLPCSNASGVATPKCDFTTAVGTLNFGAGETSKTITVLISQDSFVEGPETITLTLSNQTGGAALAAPSTAVITVADDVTEPATNVIDDTRNFVRQHYHDFLNREPDQSGWDFWTNQITSCGNDAQCNEVRRVDVSVSFFLSIEFQQSGYLVERFYKTGYGDATGTSQFVSNHPLNVPIVRFSEFLKDTQRIGQGVIVLAPGWEQALENNKQAYALEFVQTSRFTTALPTTLTPTQFVDRLNQNTGGVLSLSERTTAINLFGASGNSSNVTARAQAVRQVADDPDLFSAEFNRAFVLAEYFGYLRRNPNDAPETTLDYTGYDFWLTKLNQFNGNYINAEMVKAFLSSIEYRQRFGP